MIPKDYGTLSSTRPIVIELELDLKSTVFTESYCTSSNNFIHPLTLEPKLNSIHRTVGRFLHRDFVRVFCKVSNPENSICNISFETV